MRARPDPALCFLALGLAASTASAQVFPVAVETATRQTSAGDSISYDLYVPQALPSLPAPPWPALVLNHGFARDKRHHADTARFLAERGLIVLVPNLVSLLGGEPAQLRNVVNTVDHMSWLRTRSATPGDRLFGVLDPLRIGLAGHSAGGAIALEAARVQEREAGLPVSALVLLDAVPWPRTLARAEELLPIFALSLRSDPSACNAFGSGLGVLDVVRFPMDDVRVVQATHCDPEGPSDVLCALACGAATEHGRSLYRWLLYSFLRETLKAPPRDAMGGFREGVEALAAEGEVVAESYGPPLSLRLKVNGRDPEGGAAATSSSLRLSLDVVAGPAGPPLDWYFAAAARGFTVWFTASGPSTVPSPAARGPALPAPDVTLLDAPLAPGSLVTFGVGAADSGQAVTADAITVVTPAP